MRYDAIWWDAFESIFFVSLCFTRFSLLQMLEYFLELSFRAKWQRQTVISNSQLRFGELCLTRFKLIYSPLSANFRGFFAIFHNQVKSDEYNDDYEVYNAIEFGEKTTKHISKIERQRKKRSVERNYQWKYPSIQ